MRTRLIIYETRPEKIRSKEIIGKKESVFLDDVFDIIIKNKTQPKRKIRTDKKEINLNLLAVNSMGFSVPTFILLVLETGAPQCGHEEALSDICLPHSLQSTNAIIPSYLKMGLSRLPSTR